MANQDILTIKIERLKSGEFFISGAVATGRPVTTEELRRQLFPSPESSEYAAMAEPASLGNLAGIILPPGAALEYFADTGVRLQVDVTWSPEILLLQKAAFIYKQAIDKEQYAPSFNKWRQGYFGWKLQLPKESAAQHKTLLREGQRLGIYYLQDWFNDALQDILRRKGALPAYRKAVQVVRRVSRSQTAQGLPDDHEWLDEEQWLVSIGWKEDNLPYRICVQLQEPDTEMDTAWQLRVVLQDKARPDEFLQTTFDGRPVHGRFPEEWPETMHDRISKDIERIIRMVPQLQPQVPSAPAAAELDDDQAWEFLNEGSMQLMDAGTTVMLPGWWQELAARKPRLKGRAKPAYTTAGGSMLGVNQIIQFDWRVAVGDAELSEQEFARLTQSNRRLIRIRGQWILLQADFLKQVRDTIKRVHNSKGLALREVLAMHLQTGDQADAEPAADDTLASAEFELELDHGLDQFIQQLEGKSALQKVPQPKGLHGQLRQYQLEGVSWLLFLRRHGIGGCLADDMGLGKTIQFIAYLLHTRQQSLAAPALLICPTSVLGNWQKELERFAPSLRVFLHYGPHRAKGSRFREAVWNHDLVLTSYALSSLDSDELESVKWDCICLDEAQNIKNAYTKQSSTIRRLEGGHKIALTGTPIENRLSELWSIMDFLNPGYLGTLHSFNENYAGPIEKTKDPVLTDRLQKLVRPFLMRRVKKDPAIQLDLPDKNELKTFVSLTPEQGALYENVVQDLFERLGSLSGIGKKGLILASLTKLKQICDHPALFLRERTGNVRTDRSNKTIRLLEMVRELRDKGEKCLIFTQYVDMGNILQSLLGRELGEEVVFMYGGVPKSKRDEMIEHFQQPSTGTDNRGGVFILSLKAGGTGLNLTAANHVFHFDRWWNPAVENQATDRAFRIGQTRDVQVHKFVTLGTLEERIDSMIEQKEGLSRQIVGSGENWITEMTSDELRDLFALRKEWMED